MAKHSFRAISSVVLKPARLLKAKQTVKMRINWFTHCLFSNEMNLWNLRATDRGTQFNAAHAQLLQKLRPIAFAETCRFLTIQSSEFQEIWPKNSLETAWMIYHYFIRAVLTEGISCQFVMGKRWRKSNDWIFLKWAKINFLSLVFNQPSCHGNSTHPNQNARINSSVVNLYSCKKQAPNLDYFKNNKA